MTLGTPAMTDNHLFTDHLFRTFLGQVHGPVDPTDDGGDGDNQLIISD